MQDCLFCKIIEGSIPASIVYEDKDFIVFKDVSPQAEIHLLLVLRQHFATLAEMTEQQAELLGVCLKKLAETAPELGFSDGYRLVVNQGEHAGQTVFHLHVHILGGRKLSWNPG